MQDNKQEKSPIKQRILQYLEIKGISKYEFYKKTGITRGVLDQNTGISEENLARFIAYDRDINLEWLVLGVGDMQKNESYSTMSSVIKEPTRAYTSPKDETINKLTKECNDKANRIIELMDQVSTLKEELATLRNADGAESRIA